MSPKLLLFLCGFGILMQQSIALFEEIQNVAKSAEEILLDISRGVKYLSTGIRYVGGILNDAIEEHCVYSCPDGSKPKHNPSHQPSFDGCGSFGVQVPSEHLPVTELTNCCNLHDICYDTCNSDKEECDSSFKKCLYKICEKSKPILDQTLLQGCKAAAKIMYTSTVALGCNAYTSSQSKACICVPKHYKEKNKKYHREL